MELALLSDHNHVGNLRADERSAPSPSGVFQRGDSGDLIVSVFEITLNTLSSFSVEGNRKM